MSLGDGERMLLKIDFAGAAAQNRELTQAPKMGA
jgi:hypothetical protein